MENEQRVPETSAGCRNVTGPEEQPYLERRAMPGVAAMGPPMPMPEKMKPRNISIQTLDHGYLVTCGCKNVCIESKRKLLSLLERYLTDAGEIENAFYAEKLF